MAIKTLGAGLGYLNRLFVEGTVAGFPDDQLLDRFLTTRDGAAFETLMARHGPMVLRVCRGVLHNPSDAEDAFQATFLVLVKKARTLRGRSHLGGWLYLVAYRVAIQANAAAARRRVHELRAGEMSASSPSRDPVVAAELLPALHEEIARLPERLRLAVVLCDLQGVPQAEAAESLRWSTRTLQRRLAEGRARLKARIDRRGLAWGQAVMTAARLREAGPVLPPAWREATIRAALDLLDPTSAASAAAQSLTHEVLKTMLVRKLTVSATAFLGVGLMTWAAAAALDLLGDDPKGAPAAVARQAAPAPRAEPHLLDTEGRVPVGGRVLDPDGRPVAGAGVYVWPHAQAGWGVLDPMSARQRGRVATTDADGRFQFNLDKGASEVSYHSGQTGWHKAQLAVDAPGFAPAWVEVGDLVKGGATALRLGRDDVPVRGRVLDSQGRPLAGVVVRLRVIWQVEDGTDLDAMLASGTVDEKKSEVWRRYGVVLGPTTPSWQEDPAPLWPGGRNAWTTGADGRFEIRGIGRDRIARLEFHGGGVADGTLDVLARPSKVSPSVRPFPSRRREAGIRDRQAAFLGNYPQGTALVAATFDYIAGPAKPFVGVVRRKGSGRPVEGAVVRIADPATHTAVTARTDAAGRFRIDGVPKGEFYHIELNPRPGIDAFLRRWEIVDDTEGLRPIEATLEVSPGVIVTGRLVDPTTGRPVPPATVESIKAPENTAAERGSLGFSRLADSRFGLTVPPGRVIIAGAASLDGRFNPYARARLKPTDRGKGIDSDSYANWLGQSHAYSIIDAPADAGPVVADLELTRGRGRAGRLVGPDGRPVVGAEAHGLAALWWMRRTLDADTFEVGGLEPGHPRQLVFRHEARKLGASRLLRDGDLSSDEPLEIPLVPTGTVAGRLVDDDGQPWAGATLHVGILYPDHPSAVDAVELVPCDARGRFRIEGVVPGVETEVLSIDAPNRPGVRVEVGTALRNCSVKPGEVRDLGDLKAKEMRPQ